MDYDIRKDHKTITMKRVTGLGGVFFKTKDPKGLGEWYKRHLNLPVDKFGAVSLCYGLCPHKLLDNHLSNRNPEGNHINNHSSQYFARRIPHYSLEIKRFLAEVSVLISSFFLLVQ